MSQTTPTGKTYIFDAEWLVEDDTDIVMDAVSLHCIVFKERGVDGFIEFSSSHESENNVAALKHWFSQQENATYVGHNILNADFEVFRRLLDIPFSVGPDSINGNKCTFIDTFTLSKRLNPDRLPANINGKSLGVHGLAAWARRAGSMKIAIDDWTTKPVEVYLGRCRGDVLDTEAAYEMMLEEKG